MVNSDTLIVKKTSHAGTKNVTFKDGTKCFIHFQTRLCNSDKTLLDDSRNMGNGKPLELIIGKKFKLEVWEVIIQKMSLNEIAQFTVGKNLVLQYPFVSKTLRDMHIPIEQRKGHMCSMTLQTEGVGYEDLNKLIKQPTDLEFTFELLDVKQPDDYEKELWQLSEGELLQLVPELKQKGNNEYNKKNYDLAADTYARAVGILEQLMLKEKPNDTEWTQLNEQKNVVLLNFAQCKLIQHDFYAVIEHCTTVLNSDPNNVKALFRRGKANIGAWNPTAAKEDFFKVIHLDPTLRKTVKKELEELEELIRHKDEDDMNKLKNLFI